MKKILTALALVGLVAIPGHIHAGTGLHMKCGAVPATDPRTGEPVKPCGFETQASFGGGMMFEQITGYCRSCTKLVYLSWTRENLPEHLRNVVEFRPRPKPLGEIWDSKTGEVRTVWACPDCKAPFIEIKSAKDIKHCPRCNRPGFGVDKTKPVMMFD